MWSRLHHMSQKFSAENETPENLSTNQNADASHHMFPVKLQIGVFFALLTMTFLNMGISHLPIPAFWITVLLLAVAIVQMLLVAFIYMELALENKFFTFIFVSTLFFISLFIAITLSELSGRDFFDPLESTHFLRAVDQNGNFAPKGPEVSNPPASQPTSPAPTPTPVKAN